MTTPDGYTESLVGYLVDRYRMGILATFYVASSDDLGIFFIARHSDSYEDTNTNLSWLRTACEHRYPGLSLKTMLA